MKNRAVVAFVFLVISLMLGAGNLPAGSIEEDANVNWTHWKADHYAIVDDGETIWIGTGSGLVSWDKASQTYTRLSSAEGMPHWRIFTGAVDGAGNRWFGGDVGLSRLAKNGEWTHYNKSNSGIFDDNVPSIAVTGDGVVYMSHAESSYVSRLAADGSWDVYPNRHTAVTQGFASIKQTLNQNGLWAATDDEVWVDYEVFDGANWHNRVPTNAYGLPLVMAAGSNNKVWALESEIVFFWDGDEWSEYRYSYDFAGELHTLTVDKNDGVWVAGSVTGNPYSGQSGGYTRLPEEPGDFLLEEYMPSSLPIAALLATDEGLWGIGPNWLFKPDGTTSWFRDTPSYSGVGKVVVDRQGQIWVYSGGSQNSALQTVDDMGTATMHDDLWVDRGEWPSITVLEPAPDGDLWVGWQYWARFSFAGPPTRYHGDEIIGYYPPSDLYPQSKEGFIEDIFTQDGQHIWFVYRLDELYSFNEERGVWSLDDGGTPAYYKDDKWASYPIESNGTRGTVAVVEGQIWYGDSTGLYFYEDDKWKQLNTTHVEGLVPGASGELYVDLDGEVLIVERDGRQWTSEIPDFVANNLARVQLTERRNRMWTVAPDGAVWYWQSDIKQELTRRNAQGFEVLTAPTISDYVEVDENNRVWLADGGLWRLSPEPDFAIEIGPASWYLMNNGSRSGQIQIKSVGGYQERVDLSVSGLPDGVTAEIRPESLPAGETAVLTLTSEDAALGEMTVTVIGSSGTEDRQDSFTLTIVEYVHDMWLPIVGR